MTDMDIEVRRIAESRIGERDLSPQSFGTVFCDHMLVAECRDGRWMDPRIEPYGPLPLPPSISALQYGISVFEGHKAFRTVGGDVVLFRRLVLPEVPEDMYIEGLRELIRTDLAWIPEPDEGSLYIRPCVFATDAALRVGPSSACRFVIFTSAV